jgi:hypothetical protein
MFCACRELEVAAGDEENELEAGADKQCTLCQFKGSQPSAADVLCKRTYRAWGLKNWYGQHCGICRRVHAVRFSYMTYTAWCTWLQFPQNSDLAYWCFMALDSLIENGFKKISVDMLQDRVHMLQKWFALANDRNSVTGEDAESGLLSEALEVLDPA